MQYSTNLVGGGKIRYIVNKHTNIVAQFGAHFHFDNLDYDNGVLSITTLCAMYQQWSPNCPEKRHGRIYGNGVRRRFDKGQRRKANPLRVQQQQEWCPHLNVEPSLRFIPWRDGPLLIFRKICIFR